MPVAVLALGLCACESSAATEARLSPVDTSNASLQALAFACLQGLYDSCDQLWNLSDTGSDFERIGATCGGLLDMKTATGFADCTKRFLVVVPSTIEPEPTLLNEATAPSAVSLPTSSLIVEPADNTWIVIVGSLTETNEAFVRGVAEAEQLRAQASVDAAILSSSRFPSLNPGFVVIYVGQYGSADEAKQACAEMLANQIVPDCYARFVGQASG